MNNVLKIMYFVFRIMNFVFKWQVAEAFGLSVAGVMLESAVGPYAVFLLFLCCFQLVFCWFYAVLCWFYAVFMLFLCCFYAVFMLFYAVFMLFYAVLDCSRQFFMPTTIMDLTDGRIKSRKAWRKESKRNPHHHVISGVFLRDEIGWTAIQSHALLIGKPGSVSEKCWILHWKCWILH